MPLERHPVGPCRPISTDIVDLVKIIDASGLDYRVTATGTIIEGVGTNEWT